VNVHCVNCNRMLLTVVEFTGAVETKCNSCGTIHTYRYGSTGVATAEIRCPNSFKGRVQLGGWCGRLIGKISQDTIGTLGYRCHSCRANKTVTLTPRVLAST